MTPGASAQAGRPVYLIHYFKEPRELVLNVEAVALLDLPGALTAKRKAARDEAGLLPIEPDPVTIPGWSLATTAQAQRSAAQVEKLVAQLVEGDAADFASPVFFDGFGGPLVVTPDLFVGFHENVAPQMALTILQASGAGVITAIDYDNLPRVYRLRASSRNGVEVLAAANALAVLPEVSFAEPDMIFTGRADLVPDDPDFADEWGIHNTGQSAACNPGGNNDMDMDGPEAWDVTTGDPAIRVVIIDSGYQLNHPDLNHSGFGADFTGEGGGGGPVWPCDRHGTAVAGCVASIINNNTGGVGIAPGCQVASARPFIPNSTNPPCANWNSLSSWTANALTWAQNTALARVTNNSNSYGFTSGLINTAYESTRNAGLVHFASAGNNSGPPISYPSNLPTVNSISAVNSSGNLAGFSSFGAGLDFSAPGEGILTTDRTGSDGYVSGDTVCVNGTSFAAPYAAGVAALALSVDANLTSAQVESIMQLASVDRGPAGYDTSFGWGFVNADQSVTQEPPSNDDCAGAALITVVDTDFNTFAATTDGPPLPAECDEGTGLTLNNDIWFLYVPECTGTAFINTCFAANFNARLAAYSGTCDALELLTCSDNSCGSNPSMQVPVVCGRPYRIRLGANAIAFGQGTLFASCLGGCPAPCPWDFDGDGSVGINDFLSLLKAWGPNPGNPADVNGDGVVGIDDFLDLLAHWGACP